MCTLTTICLFVCFFLCNNTRDIQKCRFAPHTPFPHSLPVIPLPDPQTYIQTPPILPSPSLSHPLIHPDIPPPRRPALLLTRKHLLRIANLSSLTDLSANLARELQLHCLHGQHASRPRPCATTTTASQSSGAGADELALCPSAVPRDG